ncbi:MAG: DUF6282 family protein [Candidatus Bathyarchaeota archaeon]|nr:DUF6282 family protein [Candidatus Bathyarchaeota archaeon]
MNKTDIVNRILTGSIDCHVHAGPGIFGRTGDAINFAKQARAYGIRGIVLKNHQGITSDTATLVNKMVSGVDVYGGVVLNRYVGGINPYAVEIAIRLGAKIVWMPTQWAKHHADTFGAAQYKHMKQIKSVVDLPMKGISILDEKGKITPETKQVLQIVKEADVALATSHLTKEEIKILVKEANKMGINKIIITHITFTELWKWSIQEQKELVDMGATIEHVAVYCMENRYLVSPKEVVEMIEGVGYKNVLIGSDCGQLRLPTPPEALRLFVGMLLDEGMEEYKIHYMMKDNPIRLLGLG